MTDKHDYATALGPIEYETELRKVRGFESTPLSDTQLAAIRHALKVADKLSHPPSESMKVEVARAMLSSGSLEDRDVFKAMVEQLLKEVNNAG